MGLNVETPDGELPRAPHEGTYIAPSGHRAWFPEGAPLIGGYIPEENAVPAADAEGTQTRARETAAQKRRGRTTD